MLLQLNPDHCPDLTDIIQRWEKFRDRLGAFQDYLTDQKQQLQGKLQERLHQAMVDVDRFVSAWQGLRPKPSDKPTPQLAAEHMRMLTGWSFPHSSCFLLEI